MPDLRLLILGGTADARTLADAAAQKKGIEPITSLAGRTEHPRLPKGDVRRGGFGGVDGLADYLTEAKIDLLIDATHPYAARITAHAYRAARETDTPHVILQRPAWQPVEGDRWIDASHTAMAAAMVRAGNWPRVFLTVGRQELGLFDDAEGASYIVRLVEQPKDGLPLTAEEVIEARGPFDPQDELELMRSRRIGCLVSKNGGGDGTYGKIEAARKLEIPVVMIDRPPLPPRADVVDSVAAALKWIEKRMGK